MSIHHQTPPKDYLQASVSDSIRKRMQGTKWGSLLLIGPPGTGKTHIIWALSQRLHKRDRDWEEETGDRKDLPSSYIVNECAAICRNRYDWGAMGELADYAGVLCVDDLGFMQPSDWEKKAVYFLANERYEKDLKTIWTTNLTMERLTEWYGGAIASRISGGVVIPTGGEDRRQK